MRTATAVEASGASWDETVAFVVEAEKLGLDACWVAEAWSSVLPHPGEARPMRVSVPPSTPCPSTSRPWHRGCCT